MISIWITSNSGRDLLEAAQDLLHLLEPHVVHCAGAASALGVAKGQQILLGDQLLTTHIPEFIEAICRFYHRHGRDVALEIEFCGNKVIVDALSIHRVEADIRSL